MSVLGQDAARHEPSQTSHAVPTAGSISTAAHSPAYSYADHADARKGVERVTLAPSEKYVNAVLLNAPATVAGAALSVEAWYAHLPARVQEEVTLLEFRDIVGALEGAGTVEVSDLGDVSVEIPSTRRRVRLALSAGPALGELQ